MVHTFCSDIAAAKVHRNWMKTMTTSTTAREWKKPLSLAYNSIIITKSDKIFSIQLGVVWCGAVCVCVGRSIGAWGFHYTISGIVLRPPPSPARFPIGDELRNYYQSLAVVAAVMKNRFERMSKSPVCFALISIAPRNYHSLLLSICQALDTTSSIRL